MDFEFDDDQELLRETVRRFLTEQAPISPYVREQLDTAAGTSAEVWSGLAALGVTGLLVAEAHGGGGRGMVDIAVVLEEMGSFVHPGPFVSTAVGAATLVQLVAEPAERAGILEPLVAGRTIATVVTGDPPGAISAEGSRLSGSAGFVPDATASDLLLVAAETGDGLGVFAVEAGAAGLTVTPTPTVDATRKQGSVELRNTPARRLGRGDASAALAETTDRVTVAMVVDGGGTAQHALRIAVGYAKEREQFGRPIGSFQAVQHLCADMLQAVELGRAAGYYASWACDAADASERRRATAVASAFGADGFYRVAASAIQVLGGLGFTWEHDAHLLYKRLLTLQQHGGAPHAKLEALAALILD